MVFRCADEIRFRTKLKKKNTFHSLIINHDNMMESWTCSGNNHWKKSFLKYNSLKLMSKKVKTIHPDSVSDLFFK